MRFIILGSVILCTGNSLYTCISNYVNKTFFLLNDVSEIVWFFLSNVLFATVTHLPVICLWQPTIYLIILWKMLTIICFGFSVNLSTLPIYCRLQHCCNFQDCWRELSNFWLSFKTFIWHTTPIWKTCANFCWKYRWLVDLFPKYCNSRECHTFWSQRAWKG